MANPYHDQAENTIIEAIETRIAHIAFWHAKPDDAAAIFRWKGAIADQVLQRLVRDYHITRRPRTQRKVNR